MIITDIRKVYGLSGSHCAFTDITVFQGNYYLGFMLGVRHRVDRENKSVVLKSSDGVNWTQSCQFYCGIDTREPKFMVMGGRLYAYFFTIDPAPHEERMITDSWCAWTDDGRVWSQPVRFAQEVKYWRPVCHGDAAYCVTHPKDPAPDRPCRLMRSADALHWEFVSDIPVDPMDKPNEASIAFDGEGILYVFQRTDRGDKSGWLLRARPPYREYEARNLGRQFGGPLLWLDGGRIYLGARFYTEGGIAHSGVFCLDDDSKPRLITVLPSMGDSSYMGITRRLQGEGYLLSYYSSHESLGGDFFAGNHASIYLAEIHEL